MSRIKIKDLPEDMKISREDLKKIRGGSTLVEKPLATELEGDLLFSTCDELQPIVVMC